MLIANETVAEDCSAGASLWYIRVHENPDPDRMRKLSAFINNFGYGDSFSGRRSTSERAAEAFGKAGGHTGRDADQPFDSAFHEAGKKYTKECTGILAWQPGTIVISPLPIRTVRICRFTESVKDVCGAG